MTQFFKQYNSIKPYLVNDNVPPEKERLQSPQEREELNGLYECILCASCSTSCPSFWWNPDKFVGTGRPVAGLPLHRRQPRRSYGGAARQPRRSLPPVPLPHHHELRGRLSEGSQSDQGHRQNQGNDGLPDRLIKLAISRSCKALFRICTPGRAGTEPAHGGVAAGACWKTICFWTRFLRRHGTTRT